MVVALSLHNSTGIHNERMLADYKNTEALKIRFTKAHSSVRITYLPSNLPT